MKFTRIILILTLMVFLSLLVLVHYSNFGFYENNHSAMVNIRNSPSMKGKIVGTLNPNETLIQLYYKNNWSLILSQYNFGYVYHKLISKEKIQFFNKDIEHKYLLYSIVILFVFLNFYFFTRKNKEHESAEGKKEQRIFSCPTCKQKIRVYMPILDGIGKCPTCNSRFSVYTDEHDHIYIEATGEYNMVNDDDTISSIEDCFKLLGLPESATEQEITKAYRKMINKYHPDKVNGLGNKLKTVANLETKKLNLAHTMLKNKVGRKYQNIFLHPNVDDREKQ